MFLEANVNYGNWICCCFVFVLTSQKTWERESTCNIVNMSMTFLSEPIRLTNIWGLSCYLLIFQTGNKQAVTQSLTFWHRITHCNSTPYLEVTYRKQQKPNEAVFLLCCYLSVSSIETCCGCRAICVGCDDWCVGSHQHPFVLRTPLFTKLSGTRFLFFVHH